MTTGLYCGVSNMPWRSAALVCLCTISGGTHPVVYVLLISDSGGAVSGEGLWCNETPHSKEEPISRACSCRSLALVLALALTYVLVLLPEAAKTLAALLHY